MKKEKNKNKKEIVVVLDNIRSTYNVGAIFRTADAAGVKKIYLAGITPVPEKNDKIKKVALGAENFVLWEKASQTFRVLEKLKKAGYFLIALEQDPKAKNIFDLKKLSKEKIVLVLGQEVKGIAENIKKRTDLILEIPMYGKKESLNVSVAFGIAVYYLRNLLYNKK
ncbi:MAG: TrmH family RNA methyltransferase [Minisyncoccia bacterium]